MTNEEFVDQLAVLATLSVWPADIQNRELKIAVGGAEDGAKTVLIEFARAESRFQILMGDPSIAPQHRALRVHYQWLNDGHIKAEACALIERFLAQHSVNPQGILH